MNIFMRRGWIPPRASAVRVALVCLVAVAAAFSSAQVCLAARDYPLMPMASPPVFSTVEGRYELTFDGKTFAQGGKAALSLNLAGPPVGAFLYLAGIDANRRYGDARVRVVITNGLGAVGRMTRVPVVYTARSGRGNFVSRVEITPFLSQGRNTIAISGYDLQIPEGAFAYAVTTGGPETPMKLIQVQDGADIGYYPLVPPLGPDSEVVSFPFEPSLEDRTARVVLAVTDGDPGRGDEVFGLTGTAFDQLRDTDNDGLVDIVDRSVRLRKVDSLPLGNDPANASGALEADSRAFSLEEDCLGVPRRRGGCGIGASFNLVDREYTLPAGHEHADFQVQSENPEKGDSLLLFLALHELPLPGINVLPEIEVTKSPNPTVLHAPGGDVTFEVVVTNPAGNQESLRLETLVDSDFGDLTLRGCQLPPTLAVGESYRCTFVARVERAVEDPHRNTVIAAGTGLISGAPVWDSAEAVVVFTGEGLGALGDRVWLDANRDGVQDTGESGLDGLTIILRDTVTGTEIARTTTATSGSVVGYYDFADLAPGSYTVEVLAPPGLEQTYDLDGLGTPNAAARTLAAGEVALDVDFGYAPLFPPAPAIEVTKSADPIVLPEPGGPVRFDVVVTNTGSEDVVLATLVDDIFGNLHGQGNCAVPQTIAIGGSYSCAFVGTVSGVVTAPHRDVVTAAGTGLISSLPVQDNDDAVVSFTSADLGAIYGFTWEDLDRDGVLDPGERVLEGVTVTLVHGSETVTTTTNADGWYLFDNLEAGSYSVASAEVSGMTRTTPATVVVSVESGHIYRVDFGYVAPVPPAPAIVVVKSADPTVLPEPGGLVRFDVVVINTGGEGVSVATLVDDVFGNLDGQGNCRVPQTIPMGGSYSCAFVATVSGVVAAPHRDVVTAAGTGATTGRPVADSDDAVVSFTGAPLGVIGDFVWEDLDRDGVQDPGERGLAGVTVTLSSAGLLLTTTTDADGRYLFTNLVAGPYLVQSGGVPGMISTTPSVVLVSLGVGQVLLDADFGYAPPLPGIDVTKSANPTVLPEPGGTAEFTVVVSNTGGEDVSLVTLVDDVFGDLNGEGTCSVPQTLAIGASYSCTFTATIAGNVTTPHRDVVTAAGIGAISGLRVEDSDDALVSFTRVPLGSIGDQVWHDSDRDGVQDPGETGIAGVAVTLFAGGIAQGTAYTDYLGRYLFAGLPAGVYTVAAAPPPGLDQTYDLDGLGTPNAAARTLGAGEIALDVDFGYALPLPPVPAIAVTKSADPTVLPEPGGLAGFDVVVTNTGGESVLLTTLVDRVGVVVSDLNGKGSCAVPQTLPAGGTYSCTFYAAVTGTVATPHVDTVTALGIGSVSGLPVNDDDDAVVSFTSETLGAIGDRVWDDADRDGIQDPGETGIAGVKVTLLAGGTAQGTAYTDYQGTYLFAGLPAGIYTVEVVPPTGLGQTYDLDGLGTPNAAVRTLGAGEIALDVDFGYASQLPPVPAIEVIKSADPTVLPEPGGLVRFAVVVINTGGEDVILATLVDDVFGNLNGKGTCALPQAIASGGLYNCTFDAAITGTVTTPHRDVVTAAGAGAVSGTPVTDSDDAIVNFTNEVLGAIGDQIWNDLNRDGVQDPGETGIAGVRVTLLAGGIVQGTMYTDAAGRYLFANLSAGTYTVEVLTPPGLEQTYDLDGLGTPNAATRALAAGEIALDVDFGYAPLVPPAPAIAVTKVADPTFGYLFRADPTTPWPYSLIPTTLDVAYTVEVTNPGGEPLANVTVTDDPATLVFSYQSGDTNGDGLLDPTETWIFMASWSYDTPGVYPDTVTARGTGAVSGKAVTATAAASVEAVGCGQCLGKVSELSLRWNGTADATIKVVVENDKFANPDAFLGTVRPGGVFTFGPLSSTLVGFDGTLGTNISLYVEKGGSYVFTATIHTSCSQPIYPGQDWGPNGALPPNSQTSGPFTVMSGSSKHGGLLCPIVEK